MDVQRPLITFFVTVNIIVFLETLNNTEITLTSKVQPSRIFLLIYIFIIATAAAAAAATAAAAAAAATAATAATDTTGTTATTFTAVSLAATTTHIKS
jgi:hypothetical protein